MINFMYTSKHEVCPKTTEARKNSTCLECRHYFGATNQHLKCVFDEFKDEIMQQARIREQERKNKKENIPFDEYKFNGESLIHIQVKQNETSTTTYHIESKAVEAILNFYLKKDYCTENERLNEQIERMKCCRNCHDWMSCRKIQSAKYCKEWRL